jgi:hypothetical protein
MMLNTNMIEHLAKWFSRNDTLSDISATARRDFFGYNLSFQKDKLS